uniref:SFRICE_025866 n=1 Tax=Spodoptera frugiperda TaxID=7108 RepID=A0A2H1WZ09_SPOFR
MAPRLTALEREHIIALRQSGCRIVDISRLTGITKRTIYLWIRRWEKDGSLQAHHRKVYKRATTAEQDAAIVAAHASDPLMSTRVSSTSYNISMDTVRRRLREAMKKKDEEAGKSDPKKENDRKLFCPNCNTEVETPAAKRQENQRKIMIARVFHYLAQELEELKKMSGPQQMDAMAQLHKRAAAATGVKEAAVEQALKEEAQKKEARKEAKRRVAITPRKKPLRKTDKQLKLDPTTAANLAGNIPTSQPQALNKLRATTEKFSKNRKKPSNTSPGRRTCDHSTNDQVGH